LTEPFSNPVLGTGEAVDLGIRLPCPTARFLFDGDHLAFGARRMIFGITTIGSGRQIRDVSIYVPASEVICSDDLAFVIVPECGSVDLVWIAVKRDKSTAVAVGIKKDP
jgi:hypothetical protein